MEAFDALLRDAFVTTAALALPLLGATALVGTAVAVLQAATQIQEQTLTLLPKVVLVGIMVAALGVPAMHLVAGLFERIVSALPALLSAT